MPDKQETPTIFRKWKDGTIDALFPYNAELNHHVEGYSHIGQHFVADYDHVLMLTKPANPLEYRSLLIELESLGYKIKPIKRANRTKICEAYWNMIKRTI